MNEHLFAYGTLQKEKTQIDLFGRILQGTSDTLRGYKVSTVEIRDESFLANGEEKHQLTAVPTADKNHSIKGTVFEITEEELRLADKYEPDGYKRIKVTLESGTEAWIYVAAEKA